MTNEKPSEEDDLKEIFIKMETSMRVMQLSAALDALDVVEKELRKDTLYFSRALTRARDEVKKKHGGE